MTDIRTTKPVRGSIELPALSSTATDAVGKAIITEASAPLSDGSPTLELVVETWLVTNLVVDLISDKGCTIAITRLPVERDVSVEGKVSDVLTIPAGGGADAGIYENMATPRAKVTVTKTEAGDMTYVLTVRGLGC